MTTKVHIVNFGPGPIRIEKVVDPNSNAESVNVIDLYAQASIDDYVYDGQDLRITEKKQQ